MNEIHRLDGSQARLLEILTGVGQDLLLVRQSLGPLLKTERAFVDADAQAGWTITLVQYGRCFGKGLRPWGASKILSRLPQHLRRRHKYFLRLRDTLISHPGGLGLTHTTVLTSGVDGAYHVHSEPIQMFSLGRLEARDLLELVDVLQAAVDLKRIEVGSTLQLQMSTLTPEQFRQLPIFDQRLAAAAIGLAQD